MKRWCVRVVGLWCGAALGQAFAPASEAETNALAEIRAQRGDGLIAVQPWVQVVGDGRLGVGWLTSQAADGVVEWTQDDGATPWRVAWYSEDGLRQANGTSQRALLQGYDPTQPVRLRARSRPITAFKPYKVSFGEAEVSVERRLPPQATADGRASFLVFNDIHSRVQLYPPLVARSGAPVNFAVLNGDVLQDPSREAEISDYLLQPMAWFSSRGIPCFFLRGNHETRGAAARALKSFLTLPDQRYFGALNAGAARVLLLDCGEDKPDASDEYSGLVDFDPYLEEQRAWLERELAGEACRRAAWRIVVVHIPPDWRKEESRLWHGERRMRERFAPLFDAGRVDVVISGHNHKAEVIEPCPDAARGFRWPVFVGGAHPLANATVIRVDADAKALRVACIKSDGTVAAEKRWEK